MSQVTSGIRSVLSHPRTYDAVQSLLGANTLREILVRDYIAPLPHAAVLEVGCGTGALLEFLPKDTIYTGIDTSHRYISFARRKFDNRGSFLLGTFGSDAKATPDTQFDLVLSVGVLHHLDDDAATHLVEVAAQSLKPSGCLITVDPAWPRTHRPAVSWIMRRDRGQNIRYVEQYGEILSARFGDVVTRSLSNILRIPYLHGLCIAQGQRLVK